MFKIGEFSKLTQVSIRMLRYYDEMGLLKPAKVDEYTSYRLYSAEQIPILNKIVFLRDVGFQVAEIKTFLDQWDNAFVMKELEQKQLEIEDAIAFEQSRLSKIQQAKKDIQQEKIGIHYNVSIKSIPSYQVLSLRKIVPDYYAEGLLWKEMQAFVTENELPISSSQDTFTLYHDMDYRETDLDIEICVPINHIGANKQGFSYRNTEAIPTMVYGSFENIAGAFYSFAGWLQEHSQYEMSGKTRQIVHRGPWNEENPDNYLTEIQIPLEKKCSS